MSLLDTLVAALGQLWCVPLPLLGPVVFAFAAALLRVVGR